MSLRPLECLYCKCGFVSRTDDDIWSYCKAFPNGIPIDIISGKVHHHNVRQDQVGEYVFDCKEDSFYFNVLVKRKKNS